MTEKLKTILISGYYGYGNTGDEAILSAMIVDLRAQIPEVEIIVVSGNPEDTKTHHQVDAIAPDDLQLIIHTITVCDLVILGGGGLFHDYWGFVSESVLTTDHAGIALYSSIILLAHILEKPLMLYAVGIGPLQTDEGRFYTRGIIELAHTVSVRDKDSINILHSLGVNTEDIVVTADPAFSLKPNKKEKGIIDRATQSGPVLGVALRYWDIDVSPDDWEEQVADAIDSFIDAHNGSVVFIPFQKQDETLLNDLNASERVLKRMSNHDRVLILEDDYSPAEIAGLIAECDLFLGMRMHSIIFAINSGTPTVGLVYDPKVQSLMEQAGIEEYAIPLSEANAQSIKSLLDRAFSNMDSLKTKLRSAGSILKGRALENAELAISVMNQMPNTHQPLTNEGEQLLKQTAFSLSNVLQEKNEQCKALEKQILQTNKNADELKNELAAQRAEHKKELHVLEKQILQTNKKADELGFSVDQKNSTILHLDNQLKEIKGSRGWKLLWFFWELRSFFIPKGSRREKFAEKIWRGLVFPLRYVKRIFFQKSRILPHRMSRYAFAFDLYKRARSGICPPDLRSLRLPSQEGLVSIVLPVYNGADLVVEALDSVMGQTYEDFELIVINDGSQDNSGEILDEYADKDSRIRVYHQENKKLPITLSRGFQEAKGEYLTWISHDNRLKPDFLEKMVACLQRHPGWDMIYANQDIIAEDGTPLIGTDYYRGYHWPPGSEHVHLPKDTAELNTRPNNFIGGAFLYRDRVAWLLGDYSPLRYTREDYDYWMRVNSLMTLRHADFLETVYEYRFHSDSLTYKDEELGITRDRRNLMVFDDFRRDFYLTPMTWIIEEDKTIDHAVKEISTLNSCIDNAGHASAHVNQFTDFRLPRLCLPFVYLRITSAPDLTPPIPKTLPPNTTTVLFCLYPKKDLPKSIGEDWDICLALDSEVSPVRTHNKQGWLVSNNLSAIFTAIDIRVRSQYLEQIEQEIAQNKITDCKISVIVCTHNRQEKIQDSLRSVSQQTMSLVDYEIIVVNNDPVNNEVVPVVEKIRKEYFSENPDHLRLIDCPISGLSFARNAGISEAKGEILYFLDDDATAASDTLELYWKAFNEHPNAGVIGGQIILESPESMPLIWKEGWEKYWSQFITDFSDYRVVDNWWDYPWGANWCARREVLLRVGGFRSGYGRRGNDFSGGEEIIAAILINKLGYTIAVLPQAKVIHHINVNRFSLDHLKNTIKAGLFTEYQAQVQLHIPVETSVLKAINQFNRALLKNVSTFRPTSTQKKASRIEAYYYISARGRLLIRQIADNIKRLRKPITRT